MTNFGSIPFPVKDSGGDPLMSIGSKLLQLKKVQMLKKYLQMLIEHQEEMNTPSISLGDLFNAFGTVELDVLNDSAIAGDEHAKTIVEVGMVMMVSGLWDKFSKKVTDDAKHSERNAGDNNGGVRPGDAPDQGARGSDQRNSSGVPERSKGSLPSSL